MDKIIEYKMICENEGYFSVAINNLIKEGWHPYGSLCVNTNSDYPYTQSMVKYKGDNNNERI